MHCLSSTAKAHKQSKSSTLIVNKGIRSGMVYSTINCFDKKRKKKKLREKRCSHPHKERLSTPDKQQKNCFLP